MNRWDPRRLAPLVLAAGVLASTGLLAVRVWPAEAAARLAFPALIALSIAAAGAVRFAAAPRSNLPARMDLAFVLTALVGLPTPAATLVAIVAVTASLVSPPPSRPRVRTVTARVAAVLLVDVAFHASGTQAPPGSPRLLVVLAMLYAGFHGAALAFGWVLDRLAGEGPDHRLDARLFFGETLSVLLAWLLTGEITAGDWPGFVALAVIVVVLGGAFSRVQALDRRLRAARDALDARVGELATLHAIGREVPSSLDPQRVCAILERECRKVLDVDALHIAIVDPKTRRMQAVHPADRGAAASGGSWERLAAWVASHKRGIRIDDLPRSPYAVAAEAGGESPLSAMAIPLIVDDHVIGVVSVASGRPAAYDEHGLALLATIGQHVAIALENARHHALATVDSLTGLSLRDAFFRRVEEEYARSKRYGTSFSLLMLDLDAFKDINDRHGHLAGDRFLGAFGEDLRARLREADLACRYGGDEFCILLPETDREGSGAIAERIRTDASALIVDVDGIPLRTTVSIGIAASSDHDGGDPRALLLRADQALYQAKRAGRNRVVRYSP